MNQATTKSGERDSSFYPEQALQSQVKNVVAHPLANGLGNYARRLTGNYKIRSNPSEAIPANKIASRSLP